ncbi:uncharacterized protein LOC131595330 isoform X2 [Vicia villosa]|uniref:uncharacterized protein LOC131595330 isoform X2 n=1 Tax=Vicia villosa TaxID=3911 RepID=UPI00273C2711|nr:uncharacterized protein LOC131595330 isoform X2 [Vicia villosa]
MGHSAAVWEFRVAAELTKGWNGVDQVVLHTPQSTSARLVGCFIMMVHLIKMLSTTAEALIMLDSCGSNIIELAWQAMKHVKASIMTMASSTRSLVLFLLAMEPSQGLPTPVDQMALSIKYSLDQIEE